MFLPFQLNNGVCVCPANKFDDDDNFSNGCELGCPTVDGGTCDTCSDKDTCTAVTCDDNKFDVNGILADGCEQNGCSVVANAASGATYICTTAFDSRVSACASDHFKTIGGTGVADTCRHMSARAFCVSGADMVCKVPTASKGMLFFSLFAFLVFFCGSKTNVFSHNNIFSLFFFLFQQERGRSAHAPSSAVVNSSFTTKQMAASACAARRLLKSTIADILPPVLLAKFALMLGTINPYVRRQHRMILVYMALVSSIHVCIHQSMQSAMTKAQTWWSVLL